MPRADDLRPPLPGFGPAGAAAGLSSFAVDMERSIRYFAQSFNGKLRGAGMMASGSATETGEAEAARRLRAELAAWVAAEVAESPWAPEGLSEAERQARGIAAAQLFLGLARELPGNPRIAAEMVLNIRLTMEMAARCMAADLDDPRCAAYGRDGARLTGLFARQWKALTGASMLRPPAWLRRGSGGAGGAKRRRVR